MPLTLSHLDLSRWSPSAPGAFPSLLVSISSLLAGEKLTVKMLLYKMLTAANAKDRKPVVRASVFVTTSVS